MNEQALATVEVPVKDVTVSRAPEIVLAEAQRAAAALKDVISKKSKPVMFNGEQYLEYEDWQTIGKFYGLTARTYDPEPIEIDSYHGARARAEILDIKTGEVVGAASAWCLRDEPNWRNKPWFQLGSMAQTRAASKAFGNVLRWVVVLAGYKGTPAEEMPHESHPTQPQEAPKARTHVEKAELYTSRFSAPEMFTSKKSGKGYWATLDQEGSKLFIFSESIAADISQRADQEITVEIERTDKGTRIVGVVNQ